MPKLSDFQASLLLEEIASAMRIGAPMDQALRRLESRRLGSVGATAGVIADGVARGLSVADALRSVDPSGQAAAAVQTCEQRGDPRLLEQIALQLRRRAQVRSESRLAWFYPWVLLAVGYLVAILALAPMIRHFHGEDVVWSDGVMFMARWLETGWWIPGFIAFVAFMLMFLLSGRRSAYSKPIRLNFFCSALAEQILHDVPESEAIKLAAEFSGEPSLKSMWEPSLLSPNLVNVVHGGSDWQRMVKESDKLSMVAALRFRARQYEEQARRRDYLWMHVLPRILMVLVGAGLILSYVWWVIAPVYRQVATW